MTNDDLVNGPIFDEKVKEIVRENGFKHKLTVKIYSNLSKINIRYYPKFRIPITHRQFFRLISQNREHVKTHCNDLYNPFHFASGKWYLDNQSP